MKWVFLLILFSSQVDADKVHDELTNTFNKKDLKPWIATALIVIDWAQTRYIATHKEYEEANPLLGRNPTLGEVNRHFVIVLGLHYLVNKTKYKNPWNQGFIIAETYAVLRNRYLGVGVKF